MRFAVGPIQSAKYLVRAFSSPHLLPNHSLNPLLTWPGPARIEPSEFGWLNGYSRSCLSPCTWAYYLSPYVPHSIKIIPFYIFLSTYFYFVKKLGEKFIKKRIKLHKGRLNEQSPLLNNKFENKKFKKTITKKLIKKDDTKSWPTNTILKMKTLQGNIASNTWILNEPILISQTIILIERLNLTMWSNFVRTWFIFGCIEFLLFCRCSYFQIYLCNKELLFGPTKIYSVTASNLNKCFTLGVLHSLSQVRTNEDRTGELQK